MTTDRRSLGLEHTIARLLGIGTAVSIGLLAIGFLLLLANGGGPRSSEAPFDLARLPADIVALRPEGVIWLGLLVALATPSARVLAALIGYLRTGEREMVVISVLVLAVIVISVIAARGLEG